MTKIITEVPQSVLDEILKSGVIYPKTDFEHPERNYAYRFISKCANMNQFFFGMQTETPEQLEAGLYHAHTHSDEPKVLLHLDIPEEELYKCALYDFGDLICITGIEFEPDPRYQESDEHRIKNSIITDGTDDDAIQVIYNRIEKDWIWGIEDAR